MHDATKKSMSALVAPAYGPIDGLRHAELPIPSPAPNQLLLRVRAAALNPLDVKLATGEMRDMMPVRHPFVLGVDAAATVAAVGSAVTGFAVGDEVVALTYPVGAAAEYTLVDAGPTVVHRPAELDATLAATLPTAAVTAAALLTEPLAGRSVLIVGATGGVGSFAVRLAASAGARVLATARPDDASYVRVLGADEVIDYTADDIAERARALVPGGVDLVVDLVNAGPGLAATAAAARPGGRLVSPLGGPDGFPNDVTAVYRSVEHGIDRLAELVKRAAAGELTVRQFADAPRAVADFATAHTRGKTVLVL